MNESSEKSQKNTYSIFKDQPFFEKGTAIVEGSQKEVKCKDIFKLTYYCGKPQNTSSPIF